MFTHLNYRRGFKRIATLLVALWLVVWVAWIFDDSQTKELHDAEACRDAAKVQLMRAKILGQDRADQIREYGDGLAQCTPPSTLKIWNRTLRDTISAPDNLLILTVPLLTTFAAFLLLRWIVRGFRPAHSPEHHA